MNGSNEIIRKYAEYFLTNNKEVMETADIAELEQALAGTNWNKMKLVTKNWVDLIPSTGIYLVKNIRFVRDGKDINECLHATQFNWKQLMLEAVDPVEYANENDALLAYYRMQAFLYYDVEFDIEHVSAYPDPTFANHLIEINNLIETSQPYNYTFELGLNAHTTDEIVEFLQPETWFAVVPDGIELAMTYLEQDQAEMLQQQAVYEFLLNTLPVTVFTKAHHLTRTTLTNPDLLDDLAGFDIPTGSEREFKSFVVNNMFALVNDFKYQQYKDLK